MRSSKIIVHTLTSILIITVGYLFYLYPKPIFYFINNLCPSFLKYPMMFLSTICDGMVALIIISFISKYKPHFFFSNIFGLAVLGVIVYLIKTSGYSPERPLNVLPDVVTFNYFLKNPTFPSGHATTAGILTATFFLYTNNLYIKIFTLFIGLLAAFARVYVGVHWPIDVWVGFWLGFLFMLDIQKHTFFHPISVQNRVQTKKFYFITYLLPLVMFSCAIFYLFYHPFRLKMIDVIMFPIMWVVIVYSLYSAFFLFRKGFSPPITPL